MSAVLPDFNIAMLQQARAQAIASKRRPIAVLEEMTQLAQADFLAWLGSASHYPVASMTELHDWQPDFEVLPFADCLRHECLPLRTADGQLLLVIADPFAQGLREWAWAHINQPFAFCLAHHSDIQAYFSRQEETQRAMENWLQPAEMQAASEDGEIISLQSIAEDASPVVRLVHSTLYNALKTNVSDIHLETTASGLVIK